MMDQMTALSMINNLLVFPLTIAAVVVCFLKGRTRAGWIGVAILLLGLVVAFPVFRVLRENDAEGWLVLPFLIGLAVLFFLGRLALQPGLPGSWWERRNVGQGTTGP